MIDHLGLSTADFDRSVSFYEKALAPLGYAVLMRGEGYAGLGVGNKPDFWLNGGAKAPATADERGVASGRPAPAVPSGADGSPLVGSEGAAAVNGSIAPHVHIAFVAPDRAAVDAFYAAAIAAGATDNGPPGLRPQYHPGYYGAFVLDPDGHNVEAVSHRPE